jgi:hypothetical protein
MQVIDFSRAVLQEEVGSGLAITHLFAGAIMLGLLSKWFLTHIL